MHCKSINNIKYVACMMISKKILAATIFFNEFLFAGGFDLPVISASQQRAGNANGAFTNDASVIYYNPAGMSRIKGSNISLSGSLLTFRGRVKDNGSTGTPEPGDSDLEEGRLLGENGVDPYANGKAGTFWPKILAAGSAFYAAQYNENITLGVGVFSPGGGNVNYKSNWAGAYQVDAIALELLNINPSMSFRFDDMHSIGLGFSVLGGHLRYRTQLDAKGLQPYLLEDLLSNVTLDSLTVTPQVENVVNNLCDVVVVSTICSIRVGQILNREAIDVLGPTLANVVVDPSSRGSGKLEMYGYGLGYNLGYIFSPNNYMDLSLSYRSKSEVNFRGRSEWYLDDIKARPVVGEAIVGLLNTQGNTDLGDLLGDYLLPETTLKTKLIVPARLSLGSRVQLSDKDNLFFDYTYIFSRELESLDVEFSRGKDPDGNDISLGNASIPLNWRDSYKASLGYEHKYNDMIIMSSGFQYDKTPIPSKKSRHPALPESDRYALSLGAKYIIDKDSSIDAAYTLLVFEDSESEYRNSCRYNRSEDGETERCTGIGGTFRGKFYDTYSNIISVQLNKRF